MSDTPVRASRTGASRVDAEPGASAGVCATPDPAATDTRVAIAAAPIVLGRGALTCDEVDRIATGRQHVRLADGLLPRLAANHAAAVDLAVRTPVYGRSTAVGALLAASVNDSDADHRAAQQLLRSHAATAGEPLPNAAVRAMTAVRLEQIAAGASGLGPATAPAMVEALNSDRMPVVGRYSSIGTGDIAALARLGLALPAGSLDPGDAMALMSSNALSLGRGCLAVVELERLLDAATVVTALTFVARHGAPGALHPSAAGPFAGPQRAARVLRRLCAGTGPAGRLQDQYGLRTAPQTLGVALDAAARLRSTVTQLSNVATENPLILTGPPAEAVHHGGFHALHLAAAIDGATAALARAMTGSQNRLALLLEPAPSASDRASDDAATRRPFLADGPPTASGLMVVEYIAAAAMGAVRAAAVPAGLQTVQLSHGVEQDAGFAPLSVAHLEEALVASRVVVAVELVAAVRALRLRRTAISLALQGVWRVCADLPAEMADRDLTDDLRTAGELLPRLAGFAAAAGDDECGPGPGRPPEPKDPAP